MSKTGRKGANDGPSDTVMPGGTRKSARIAAQANKVGSQEINDIREPSRRPDRVLGKAAISKPAKASKKADDKPSRTRRTRKPRHKPAIATPPLADNNAQVNTKEGTKRRKDYVRRRRAVQDLPPLRSYPRKGILRGRDPALQVAQALTTKDVGTQTDLVRAPLSEKALRRLERELEPDGDNLSSESRDDGMAQSRSGNTATGSVGNDRVYDPKFENDLLENGVFEQRCVPQESPQPEFGPRVPKNYDEILNAIQRSRPVSDDPTPQQYREYMELVFKPQSERRVEVTHLTRYFGLPDLMKEGHEVEDKSWTKRVPVTRSTASKPFFQKPKADRTEGLALKCIPPRIRDELGGIAIVSDTIAFPNFMVEVKRDHSMFTAHRQNRHNGSVASQAYHQYYESILEKAEDSWDIARVGSIEFNGDIVVGNVHWVSKEDEDGIGNDNREYHMTRVMNNFTFGLNFDDFKKARREARNFRDYWFDRREELRVEFAKDIEARKRELKQKNAQNQNNARAGGPSHTRQRGKRGPGRPPRTSTQRRQEGGDILSSDKDGSSNDSGSQHEGNTVEDTDSNATELRRRNRLKRGKEPSVPANTKTKKTRHNASARTQHSNSQLSQPMKDFELNR